MPGILVVAFFTQNSILDPSVTCRSRHHFSNRMVIWREQTTTKHKNLMMGTKDILKKKQQKWPPKMSTSIYRYTHYCLLFACIYVIYQFVLCLIE